MSSRDVECPYCEEWQEILHDDGQGYEEDRLHEQDCYDCGKTFTFTTYISYDYTAYKADCLNGADHQWRTVPGYPLLDWRLDRCESCSKEMRTRIKEKT